MEGSIDYYHRKVGDTNSPQLEKIKKGKIILYTTNGRTRNGLP